MCKFKFFCTGLFCILLISCSENISRCYEQNFEGQELNAKWLGRDDFTDYTIFNARLPNNKYFYLHGKSFDINKLQIASINDVHFKSTNLYSDSTIKGLKYFQDRRVLGLIDTTLKKIRMVENSEVWNFENAKAYETNNMIYFYYIARGMENFGGDTLFYHPGIFLINKNNLYIGYNHIFENEEPLLIKIMDNKVRVVTNLRKHHYSLGNAIARSLITNHIVHHHMNLTDIYYEYLFDDKMNLLSKKDYDIKNSKELIKIEKK